MKAKLILISLVALLMSMIVGLASAQEDTETPVPLRDRDHARIGRNILGDIADVISEATGLTNAEILQQVRDGATLSEIITANGGDVNAIKAEVTTLLTARINTAVENGNLTQERADEMLANLPDHIETLFEEVHDGRIFPRENGIIAILIGLVSDTTGLSQEEILQQVRDGATVADILSENGGDVEAVVNGVVAEITERTNARVENGNLSQERADEIIANSEELVRSWLNGEIELPRGERGNRGGRGNHGGGQGGRGNGGN